MGSYDSMLKEFKETVLKTFEMIDLGSMRYFLGLEVIQMKGYTFVSHRKYAENLSHKAGMLNFKSLSNLMN